MLLSHAVLAVVFGSLVVSAYPEPGHGGRDYYEPELHMTEGEYAYEQDNVARQGGGMHHWAPNEPQRVMSTGPMAYSHSRPSHFPWPKEPEPQPPRPVPEPPLPPWAPVPEPPEEGPVPPPPGSPPGPPGAPDKSIYQFLKDDPKFSRLFKLVNYTEDITNLLNDTSAKLTFFALPNWAFPHPPHRRPHAADWYKRAINEPEEFYDALAAAEGLVDLHEDDADKDKKEIFKAILKAILKYQTLSAAHPASELAKNVTYATSLALSDGSFDGEPLRIRVSAAPGLRGPRLSVNVVSRIVHPDIVTQNGVIHVVNKPILPPPSAFQHAFFLPHVFSVLTSSLQRVGLTDAIEWRDVRNSDGKHTVDGSPAVTVFAPTNRAFSRLPPKLHRFLFSPFGEKVLKKLLQFHITPEVILHADYVHNASDSGATGSTLQFESEDVIGLYEELHRADAFALSSDDISAYTPHNQPVLQAEHKLGSFPGAIPTPPWHMGGNPGGPPPPPASDIPHEDPWGRVHPIPPPPHGPWNMPPPPPPPSPPPYHPGHHYAGYEDYSPMDYYRSYLRQHPPHQQPYFPRPGHAEHPPHYPPPPPPPPYQPPFEHGPHFPPHGPPPPCSHYTRPFEHGPQFPPFHPHCPPPPPVAPHHPPFEHGPHFAHSPPQCPPPPPPPPFEHGPQFPPFPPHCFTPPPPPPPVAPHHPPQCPSPPPHRPPFEHGPQFPSTPHCGSPPPPPYGPHHPPFEHGPHFPHSPQPSDHGHGPFAHCPHFPPHGFPAGHVHRPPFPRPKVVYHRNLTTPTLLGNHSVNVQAAQFALHPPIPGHHRTVYYTKMFVHGTPVIFSDIPTRNGVMHVIDKLLNPRKTHTGPRLAFDATSDEQAEFVEEDDPEAEWEGWEEWLVQWANEE